MYIDRLTITNFRCFENTAIELNYPGRLPTPGRLGPSRYPNVNMFLGNNGSGKSSVFRAAALATLGPIIQASGLTSDYFVRRSASQDPDSTPRGTTAVIEANLRLSEVDSGSIDLTTTGRCEIALFGDVESISTPRWEDPVWENIFSNNSPSFFLVGYGASRRSERPEGYTEKSRSPRYQRVAGLFEDHVGLAPFTYARLQLNEFNLLNSARELLNSLLPDGLELTDRTDTQNRSLFDWDGRLLPFSALSDGYRTFVAWVWDLLLQIGSVFPYDAGGLAFFPGVVIVDEIDLFLHPEWQRVVVGRIADAFPSLQFLFSSHSPIVAGGLEPANIYVLEPDGVHQYDEPIYGLTPSQVLTSSYFGLRSTRAPGSGTLNDLAKVSLGIGDITLSEQANSEDDPEVPDAIRQMFDEAAHSEMGLPHLYLPEAEAE